MTTLIHPALSIAELAENEAVNTALAALIVATLWFVVSWLKRHQAENEAASNITNAKLEKIRHQVENTHSVNLRDDLDAKFQQVTSDIDRLADLMDKQETVLRQVAALQEQAGHRMNNFQESMTQFGRQLENLRESANADHHRLDERISELEETR